MSLSDIVLNQNTVFKNSNLDAVKLRTNHHHAVYAFAARKELALGHHGTATTSIAAIATALLFSFESRGSLNPGRLVARLSLLARLAHSNNSVGRLVAGASFFAGTATRTTTHVACFVAVAVVTTVAIARIGVGVVSRTRRPRRQIGKVRSLEK